MKNLSKTKVPMSKVVTEWREIELPSMVVNEPELRMTDGSKVHEVLRAIWENDMELVERFYVVALGRDNKVVGIDCHSKGGQVGTYVCIKTLLRFLLNTGATSFVIAHNHPSGTQKASQNDITITRRIQTAGDIIECTLLDSLILVPNGEYVSIMSEI